MNLDELRNEMRESWKKEFAGKDYLHFYLDKGHLFATRYFSRRGDIEEIELRIGTKYEIVIEDTWVKLTALLRERGEAS
jgi:hypothetical protein